MRIYKTVRFDGAISFVYEKALIDTGADISMIPLRIATLIGAWNTGQTINIIGVHGQARTLPLGVADVYLPILNDIGARFPIAVSDVEEEPIIGMDILEPLGIEINTGTQELSVKNEVWEAFKTLSGLGLIFFVGIKTLDTLFEKEE